MNWGYQAVHWVYLVGLGVWVVGDLLLGAFFLPQLFKSIPERAQAGAIAGAILAQFRAVKFGCLIAVAAASAVKAVHWENPSPPIVARWVLLGGLAATLLVSALVLAPRLEALRPQIAGLEEGHALRREFGRLHGASMLNSLIGVILGLAALFLS